MQYIIKILALLVLLVIAIQPSAAVITNVSAGSNVLSNSFQHDQNYMMYEYEVLMIAIGIACLIVSRIWESAEDIFAAGAVLPLALSSYFANFLAIERTSTVVVSGVITIVNTQIITPNPYLSLIMGIITVAAVLNFIWIFFMKKADQKTESSA